MTAKKKPKIKTEKLKAEDRIKVINLPEIMVVVPLTIAASVRYGNDTNWCTSAPKNTHFRNYLRRGVFVFVLLYNVSKETGKRVGDAHTKIALYRRWNKKSTKKGVKSQWSAYDMFDSSFDFKIAESLFEEKYGLTSKIDEIWEKEREKRKRDPKVFIHPFKEGDIIKGISKKLAGELGAGKWPYRNTYYYSRSRGKWVTRKSQPKLREQIRAEIYVHQIKKAVITKITSQSLHIKILELESDSPIVNFIKENAEELKTIVRIGKKDLKFEIIK